MAMSIGQDIKGYTITEEVNQGGFGAVYRAMQSTVGREVALKVIKREHANKPDFIRRFEAEAQLIARLEHHFIVPLYDYWRGPDGAYLVMRYLRGGSLHDLIRNHGALNIEETVKLFSQIAEGLHVAHRNQVVHVIGSPVGAPRISADSKSTLRQKLISANPSCPQQGKKPATSLHASNRVVLMSTSPKFSKKTADSPPVKHLPPETSKPQNTRGKYSEISISRHKFPSIV